MIAYFLQDTGGLLDEDLPALGADHAVVDASAIAPSADGAFGR